MRWMVTITFKEKPTEEVLAMLPAERARVAELVAQGIIEHRFFAADGAKVWFIFDGDSREAIERVLNTLPMHKYFNFEVGELS